MYEKLVSLDLSSFCEKYGILSAAQFAYRKGLGCIDALLTISHHLQKSLDVGMDSYIVQIDFSAAFDRVSHSGLLFKLKYIGVDGSVLSISTSSSPTIGRESWLMVLWVSGSQEFQACPMEVSYVLFYLFYIMLHTSEMFELFENSICECRWLHTRAANAGFFPPELGFWTWFWGLGVLFLNFQDIWGFRKYLEANLKISNIINNTLRKCILVLLYKLWLSYDLQLFAIQLNLERHYFFTMYDTCMKRVDLRNGYCRVRDCQLCGARAACSSGTAAGFVQPMFILCTCVPWMKFKKVLL